MSDTTRPSTQRRALQSFGMALLIEGGIVAVAVMLLAGALAHKPPPEPVTITLADDPPPEKKEEPKPEPPLPVPQPKLKTPVKLAEHKPQPAPVPEAPPIAQAPSPIAATPNAFTEQAPVPPPPPPAPPANSHPDLQATYDAKVRGAVHAWHNAHYPPAASTMHFSGKTQIEFHLRDGIVSGIRIMTTCGVGLFDQSSLAAVQGASYPEAPAELRGHDNLYQIWVEYNN
ncbi:MAG: energy transducer TonB [Burkholderiaceae bacterium]|nr:energy transducer TonB [Burkholderiaceae bacterium]